jgi:hypothetical protein
MMARFLRRPDAFLRHFCAILQHPRQKCTCSIGAKNALRTKGLFAAPAPAVAGTGFPRSHGPPERKVNGSRLTLRYCSRCPSHDRKRRPFDPCRPEQDDMGRTPNKPKSRRNAGGSEIMMPKEPSARTSPPIWTHAAPTPGRKGTGSGMRSGTIARSGRSPHEAHRDDRAETKRTRHVAAIQSLSLPGRPAAAGRLRRFARAGV